MYDMKHLSAKLDVDFLGWYVTVQDTQSAIVLKQ